LLAIVTKFLVLGVACAAGKEAWRYPANGLEKDHEFLWMSGRARKGDSHPQNRVPAEPGSLGLLSALCGGKTSGDQTQINP